jgi:hypothetical protein
MLAANNANTATRDHLASDVFKHAETPGWIAKKPLEIDAVAWREKCFRIAIKYREASQAVGWGVRAVMHGLACGVRWRRLMTRLS